MGFEYKIIVALNEVKEVQNILKENAFFDKIYHFNEVVCMDFRHPKNESKMPNLTIQFLDKELYLLQNGTLYLEQDITELKQYFDKHNLLYKIVEC